MWLNEIGIEIGYARLSHYTGQLKRRDQPPPRCDVAIDRWRPTHRRGVGATFD